MNQTDDDPQQVSYLGKSAFRDGNFSEAALLFEKSAAGFKMAGDLLNEAENLNNLSVALMNAGEAEAAYRVVAGTPEVFLSLGDKRRQAMALGNLGVTLKKLGKIDQAIEAYQSAAEIFYEIGEHEMRAPVLETLSLLKIQSGRPLEALADGNAGIGEYQKPGILKVIFKKIIEIPLRLLTRS
jgi:tetratricopeptide (TPR) repeat protein